MSDSFSLGFFFHILQCKTMSFCIDNLKKKTKRRRFMIGSLRLGWARARARARLVKKQA